MFRLLSGLSRTTEIEVAKLPQSAVGDRIIASPMDSNADNRYVEHCHVDKSAGLWGYGGHNIKTDNDDDDVDSIAARVCTLTKRPAGAHSKSATIEQPA